MLGLSIKRHMATGAYTAALLIADIPASDVALWHDRQKSRADDTAFATLRKAAGVPVHKCAKGGRNEDFTHPNLYIHLSIPDVRSQNNVFNPEL